MLVPSKNVRWLVQAGQYYAVSVAVVIRGTACMNARYQTRDGMCARGGDDHVAEAPAAYQPGARAVRSVSTRRLAEARRHTADITASGHGNHPKLPEGVAATEGNTSRAPLKGGPTSRRRQVATAAPAGGCFSNW